MALAAIWRKEERKERKKLRTNRRNPNKKVERGGRKINRERRERERDCGY